MSPKWSILLVDDHPVARVGLRFLLEGYEDFGVCGEADDAASARKLVEELRPDIVVLDLRLGGRDGIELLEDLLVIHPSARILVFSSLDETIYAKRALRAGARGFVMKKNGLELVGEGLKRLARGDFAFSETVQRAVFDAATGGGKADPMGELSDRELQVFHMLGEGRGTAAIAEELNLSVKTIGTYRERLKNKLNFHTFRELEQGAQDFVRRGQSLSS